LPDAVLNEALNAVLNEVLRLLKVPKQALK